MMKFQLVVSAASLIVGSTAFVAPNTASQRSSTTHLDMSAALIVQNKGGGHGELGYQLAKALTDHEKITSITILQDDACNDEKEPFKSYSSDLPDVKVVKAPLSSGDSMTSADVKSLLGDATFEYIWDNCSKGAEGSGKAICDCAKDWGVKLLTYVSSAGMYQPDDDTTFPMPETTPIKETSGQAQYDAYAVELGLPLVSFRPQYIYGEKSNKHDYIDWYFHRLVRELPLPIPEDGTQKVSLTNSKDVARLLIAPLDNEEAAVEQRFFNCGNDKLYSYDEVAYMCAEAAGIAKENVMIEHYDSELYGKAYFPFRLTNFYVAPDMAKEKLGYTGSQCDLAEDLKWYYQGFNDRGGIDEKIPLIKDAEITVLSITRFEVGSIYDKWDPIPMDWSEVQELGIEAGWMEEEDDISIN